MKAISAGATTRRRFSVRRIRSRESDPQGLVHADALVQASGLTVSAGARLGIPKSCLDTERSAPSCAPRTSHP